MKTLPTLKESVLSLFDSMVLRFDGGKYRDMDITYQFIFTDIDDGHPIHIRFSGGTAEYAPGYSEKPDVTIHTPAALWLDISGGFRNPLWSLLTGRCRITGRRSLLRLLPRLLTRKISFPRSQSFNGWTPPAKVLVLMGNPRRQQGLTGFYLQPFVEGIAGGGAKVEQVHLYEKHIKPCLGCFKCWTYTPGRCIQQDDQGELLKRLERADLVLYAFPLYYHTMPGQVKNHIDRQLPRMHPYFESAGGITRHPRRNQKKQGIALFSICGFPEIRQFDGLVRTFEAYAKHENSRLAATVLIPGAMELYHNPTRRSLLTRKLDLLRSAGEELVSRGTISKGALRQLAHVPGSRARWRLGANMHWHAETAKYGAKGGTI